MTSLTYDPATNTAEIIWTTGAKVRRSGWQGTYDEELVVDEAAIDWSRIKSGRMPFLSAHRATDPSHVLGVVEDGWLVRRPDGRKEGRARIRFTNREDAKPVLQDLRDGILPGISVGYAIEQYEEVPAQRGGVPGIKATRWSPIEFSLVPVPADNGAFVRSNPNPNPEIHFMSVVLPTPAAEEAKPLFSVNDQRAAGADVREQCAAIVELVARNNLPASLAHDLVQRGASLEQARAAVIDARAAKQDDTEVRNIDYRNGGAGGVSVRGGVSHDSPAAVIDDLGAALAHKIGAKKLPESAARFRGLSVADMCRVVVEARGHRLPAYATPRMKIDAVRKHAVSDFTHIVSTALYASVADAYASARDEIADLTTSKTVDNFLPRKTVRATDFPALREIQELGEYEHGSISESAETFVIKKYGRMFGYSWELALADRFDVLGGIANTAGLAAANLEAETVGAVLVANPALSDGTAVFHANRANYQTTGSVLSATSLAAAMVLLRRQRSTDLTTYLNLRPAFLVVSPENERLARTLTSEEVAPATPADATAAFRGLQVLVSPRIPAANWFLFPAVGSAPNLVVARLEENSNGPRVESKEGWEVDQIEIKTRHTLGVAWQDFRAVFSTGAA